MFLTDSTSVLLRDRGRAQVFDSWREAADLVRARWETFVTAEAESRGHAFAAYLAALDAEEAAAADIAAVMCAKAA